MAVVHLRHGRVAERSSILAVRARLAVRTVVPSERCLS